ncbi:hypothetical protein AAFP35_16265 [Gordonia sp. CPCC 206044]|uniref:hypothetical protein n=1 Tax=Gordonia sp. CPCC 206044 TaxID=3140793 RepID=UPI003AF3B60C
MDILESIIKVLVIGLVFGAGLPALFALGLRFRADGAGATQADGTVSPPNPALRALGYFFFAVVIAAIVLGLLWVTRQTLLYYTDIQIFPDWAYK